MAASSADAGEATTLPPWHQVLDVVEIVAEYAPGVTALLLMRTVCSGWLAAVRHRVARPCAGIVSPHELARFRLGVPLMLNRHFATVLTVLLSPVALDAYTPHVVELRRGSSLLLTEWLHERKDVWAVRLGGLQALNLTGCRSAPPKHFDFGVSLSSLRRLELSECGRVDDVALRFLAAGHSPHLTALNIGKCKGLSDACTRDLVSGWPNLTELDVSGVPLSAAGGFSTIARLPRLRVLHARDGTCPVVSILAALCGGEAATSLVVIAMSRCKPDPTASKPNARNPIPAPFPRVEALVLTGSLDRAGFAAITPRVFPSLRCLEVSANQLDPGVVATRFAHFPGLADRSSDDIADAMNSLTPVAAFDEIIARARIGSSA